MTRPPSDEPLAYPIRETARLLSVSESTVKRLLAAGTLRSVKVGGQRRVPRTELYRLLDVPSDERKAL